MVSWEKGTHCAEEILYMLLQVSLLSVKLLKLWDLILVCGYFARIWWHELIETDEEEAFSFFMIASISEWVKRVIGS